MAVNFEGDFPCTGCSLCCQTVSRIHADALNYPKHSILYRAASSFPYTWDESGSCNMLKNGLCSVYASRPLLCNVKEISKYIAAEVNCSVKDVYTLTATACNNLISVYGLSTQFMIDANQFK